MGRKPQKDAWYTTSPITLKLSMQMQAWRVLPVTEKKRNQPMQMKLCKDDFLEK